MTQGPASYSGCRRLWLCMRSTMKREGEKEKAITRKDAQEKRERESRALRRLQKKKKERESEREREREVDIKRRPY